MGPPRLFFSGTGRGFLVEPPPGLLPRYPPLVAAYLVGLFAHPPSRLLNWGIGLLMIWGCTWLNIRGVKSVGWLSEAISVMVLVPVAGMIILGFNRLGLSTFGPWIPEHQSVTTALRYALIWSLWSYSGYGCSGGQTSGYSSRIDSRLCHSCGSGNLTCRNGPLLPLPPNGDSESG